MIDRWTVIMAAIAVGICYLIVLLVLQAFAPVIQYLR